VNAAAAADLSIPVALRAGQHPDEVARACVRMVRRWQHNPWVVLTTRAELSELRPRHLTQTEYQSGSWVPFALWSWARSLTFFREPAGKGLAGEVIQSLPITVAVGGGDCDDIATALGTMAGALGFPVAIGRLVTRPGFAHVFCGVGRTWFDESLSWALDPEIQEGPVPAGSRVGTRWFHVSKS